MNEYLNVMTEKSYMNGLDKYPNEKQERLHILLQRLLSLLNVKQFINLIYDYRSIFNCSYDKHTDFNNIKQK